MVGKERDSQMESCVSYKWPRFQPLYPGTSCWIIPQATKSDCGKSVTQPDGENLLALFNDLLWCIKILLLESELHVFA